MFVTSHARSRIESRLGTLLSPAHRIIERLEDRPGRPGAVAYEVARLPNVRCDDGSNGDTVVVIAVDGSVETVMFRRSWNQPFTPRALDVEACEVL